MSLQEFAMLVVDSVMAVIPRSVPGQTALERCKIISHRGEHDNVSVMENTLEAYSLASAAGVWGIEGDIRWTTDLVPVICHDPSPQRVFGVDRALSSLTFAQLRQLAPGIPSLAEVIDSFGGKTHLMLELKSEPWPDPQTQAASLRALLAPLVPMQDFHILGLDPALFQRLAFLPAQAFLPVAELNTARISRAALQGGYAGFAGHYLLVGAGYQRRHKSAGQLLGSGFPASRNCLFRELNRGIEWIFSNDAVALQGIRDECLEHYRKHAGSGS